MAFFLSLMNGVILRLRKHMSDRSVVVTTMQNTSSRVFEPDECTRRHRFGLFESLFLQRLENRRIKRSPFVVLRTEMGDVTMYDVDTAP